MELKFMELEFHKKRHYMAPHEVIRLKKKTCILKRHYRALKNCIELEFHKIFFFFFNFQFAITRLSEF